MEKQSAYYQNIYRRYLEYMRISGYKKDTQKQYGCAVSDFLHWLEANSVVTLQSLTPEHIQQHYRYLCFRPNKIYAGILSDTTVSHSLCAITLLLSYCEQTGQISKNPISGLVFPKPAYRHRELVTQTEIKELYQAAQTLRERALLGLYYGCGLRKKEGGQLNTNDIHYKEQLLYVRTGKGDKRRVIPMSSGVTEDLHNYYQQEREQYSKERCPLPDEKGNPFLLNKRGMRMRGMAANKILSTLIKRCENKAIEEKKICIHSLRHSIATHLLENGLSVEYVRDFLGHQKLDTTQIYTRISKQQLLHIS